MDGLFTTGKNVSDERYTAARDNPKFEEQKQYLEYLWSTFSSFADPDFRDEIANQFHPRFWEMYLACTLAETGFELIQKSSAEGPDFQFSLNERKIWIEATAPNEGTGKDAVPGYSKNKDKIDVIRIPEEKIILRLTNAISEKSNRYNDYLALNIISKDDVFIIAINGFDIPHIYSEFEIPYIVQAVLPFGELTLTIDIDEMKPINEFYQYRPHLQKISGANVSTRVFQNPEYSFISGILFSEVDLWNKPTSLGEDFIFVHNPLADQKLEVGWLNKGKHIWVENNQLNTREVG